MFENEKIGALDNLLAGYVAGVLPSPVQVLMDAHLELSAKNRTFVLALEGIAGHQIEDMASAKLQNRDANLNDIFSKPLLEDDTLEDETCDVLPASLRALVGFNVNEIPWRTKMPGYREYSLGLIDGFEANMLWIKAGRKMPSHTHDGVELTLVLDGAFRDVNGRYGRGDIAIADESVDHRPIAEEGRPCICFAVTDAPLRLTGSYSQMFSDLVGR